MKSTHILKTSLFLVAALLVSSCASDTTAPVLNSSGDLTGSALKNGPEKPELSHVTGTIAEFDNEAMRLRVGDDWFWADEHTKIKIDDFEGKPSYSDLEIDDLVEIEYRTPADEGKGFYAQEIEIENEEDEDDDDGQGHNYDWAKGYVTEVDADGMSFRIGEMMFWVDEYTRYCDDDGDDDDEACWSFDDIQVGVWLKARYNTIVDEEKGYYAMLVLIKPNHEFEWAEGYAEEVDADNKRFRIGEMWFWVDEHTQYCDEDDDDDDEICWSFEDIQLGLWVKTKYRTFLTEDVGYYAMKVVIKPNHESARAEGYVEGLDADNKRFRIGEMWFWVDEHTQYCDEDDDDDDEICWSFEDIQLGVWVKTKYRTFLTEDVGYYAMKIVIKPNHEFARVEGYVEEIDGDAMRIRIGDDWYWSDEHTEIEIDGFEGDPAFGDIESGDLVKIKYLTPAQEGKGFYAKEIEVKENS